jgi:hypothetical protein
VEGLRTTQKAKQSLQQQGVTTTSIGRPFMPSYIDVGNNGSPTNRRREQNQVYAINGLFYLSSFSLLPLLLNMVRCFNLCTYFLLVRHFN